jgi:hypothetical protein
MDTTQLAETLKTLLSEGCKNEQILNTVVLRVVNSLHESSPSNSALIAELQKHAGRNTEQAQLHQLAMQLWDNITTADLRFIRRLPKVSYIYEISAYWWKPTQILFSCEEERTALASKKRVRTNVVFS